MRGSTDKDHPMQRYQNLNGNSGVVAYEIRDDAITVAFEDGRAYRYTYRSAGRRAVEDMKQFARAGRGLSTYIARHVRDGYEVRLR